jgi:hypothetical protein
VVVGAAVVDCGRSHTPAFLEVEDKRLEECHKQEACPFVLAAVGLEDILQNSEEDKTVPSL